MATVTLILSILSGLLGLLTTGMTSGINALKKENGDLKKENAELRGKADAADAKTKLLLAGEVDRREQIISGLKAELAAMEAEQNANHDPAVVRERLSKLLSVP